MGLEAALAAQAVGAVAGLAGSYTQSRAIRSQGRYEAQQLEANARLANLQAEDATSRGKVEANRQRLATRRLIGSQRAALAAQGIEVDSGSALQLQADTAALGAQDALQIESNAYREAWGHRMQATGYQGQAGMARRASRNAARNTILTGGLGFLRDAGQAAFTYSQFKPTGGGSGGGDAFGYAPNPNYKKRPYGAPGGSAYA